MLIKTVGELSDKYLSSRFQHNTAQMDEIHTNPRSRFANLREDSGILSQITLACIRQILNPPELSKFTPLSSINVDGTTFRPYRISPSYGLVEYRSYNSAHTTLRPVGYIEDMFMCHPSGQEDRNTEVYVSIGMCKETSIGAARDPYIDSPYCCARIVSRTVERYFLAKPSELKHVMRYPWGTNDQLIISVID